MTTENYNPYEAPTDFGAHNGITRLPPELASFAATATVGKKPYQVFGFEDRLQIFDESGRGYEHFRDQPLFSGLLNGLFIKRALRLKLDKLTLLLFTPEEYQQLQDWIGLPSATDLKHAVGGHSYWQFLVGVLFLGSGGLLGLWVGIGLLASWIISRIWPHRWLLLLHATFFAVFAYLNARTAYVQLTSNNGVPIFSIICLLICFRAFYDHLKQFPKYRRLRDVTEHSA